MPKTDKTDLKIVNLLKEDGRMPAAEIARRVGRISERAARYRVEKLIQLGVIHVGAVVNPKQIGLAITADVWLQCESDAILTIAQQLTHLENVTYVACAIGETDVSVQVVGRDTEEVYRFVTEVIGKIPGVHKTITSIVPLVLKDVHQWKIPAAIIEAAQE